VALPRWRTSDCAVQLFALGFKSRLISFQFQFQDTQNFVFFFNFRNKTNADFAIFWLFIMHKSLCVRMICCRLTFQCEGLMAMPSSLLMCALALMLFSRIQFEHFVFKLSSRCATRVRGEREVSSLPSYFLRSQQVN
jgi:hypothetical protein